MRIARDALVEFGSSHMNKENIDARSMKYVSIAQGEYKVSGDPQLCMTTLLGSCVATCLWDSRKNIGGMNHYLLPGHKISDHSLVRYGVNAMELLVNGLLKRGCHKADLKAKVFGGAQMLHAGSTIGSENGRFAQDFLRVEGIAIVGGSLGGQRGRRLRFFPTTGRVQQKLVDRKDDQNPLFKPVLIDPAAPSGNVELFHHISRS